MARKNKTSETINKVTPIFRPLCTAKVWFPIKVPSDITSLNQKNILDINSMIAKINNSPAYEKLCIVSTIKVVRFNKLVLVKIGQGEGETK